jgi:hypothetical protein
VGAPTLFILYRGCAFPIQIIPWVRQCHADCTVGSPTRYSDCSMWLTLQWRMFLFVYFKDESDQWETEFCVRLANNFFLDSHWSEILDCCPACQRNYICNKSLNFNFKFDYLNKIRRRQKLWCPFKMTKEFTKRDGRIVWYHTWPPSVFLDSNFSNLTSEKEV